MNIAPDSAADISNPGMDSAIDALFSETPPAPETPAAETPAPAESVDTPAETSVETPVEGEAAPAEGEAEAEEVDPVAEELTAEDDSETDAALEAKQPVNPLDLASTRGQRIYRSYKALKEISETLGMDLTPPVAKSHYEAFTDKMAMEQEFQAATPETATNWLAYWNNTSPQGMASVASQLPQLMLQHNHEAYRALALPVMGNYINSLYTRAQAETRPDVKEAMIYAARMAEWDLTGKFRDDATLQGQQNPSIDPRSAQIDARWSQIQNYENQRAAEARSAWDKQLTDANDSTLTAEVDKVLAPLQKALPSQRLFSAAKASFINAVKDLLSKDGEGERAFNLSKQAAMGRLSSEDIKTLNAAYAARANRAVRVLAPDFLKESGVALKTQSAQRQKTLEAAQAVGKAPSGSGAPAPKSIAAGAPKQFRSNSEKMDSMLDDLLK